MFSGGTLLLLTAFKLAELSTCIVVVLSILLVEEFVSVEFPPQATNNREIKTKEKLVSSFIDGCFVTRIKKDLLPNYKI